MLLAYHQWKRETAIAADSPWPEWLPVVRAEYSANGILSADACDQVHLRSDRMPIGGQVVDGLMVGLVEVSAMWRCVVFERGYTQIENGVSIGHID